MKNEKASHWHDIGTKIVREDGSKIFADWQTHFGTDKATFLDGLDWLGDDPLTESGKATRAIAPTEDGGILHLQVCHGLLTAYRHMDGTLYAGVRCYHTDPDGEKWYDLQKILLQTLDRV